MGIKDRAESSSIAVDMEFTRQKLIRSLVRQAPEQGLNETGLEGLSLIRCNEPGTCAATVYTPSLNFIIQGRKTLELGDREISYMPLSYVATSVHLPILGRVEDASLETPFLGVKVTINPKEVADLVMELGDKAPGVEAGFDCPEVSCGLCLTRMDHGMLDALNRLVTLLDSPKDAPILAPLARREIIYRALMGEIGARMRKFAMVDSQANRVSRVIEVLKDRFSEPLRISELAGQANMSESSLYHSFKQITRMSPLQFQKKLRLHEARRLMLTEGIEAASASYRVGYESPSHFSREYSRMFGLPPRADVVKLRGEQRVPA
ncbi:AraC family transcriptional regulator [Microbulbifer sp. OS29]|uniref:AraC family transcriptional regulator n=1 Tax=Microbulbifer okhotskensis TaxID=2926617 RepID=A0A9X2J3L0_9GAMM|nr:AraC family transcriptional regulator [Microbulbifer okhotskensis]MCO1333657.1 AraC family transcriptional regulator [Microbulbifer okhotskensis]